MAVMTITVIASRDILETIVKMNAVIAIPMVYCIVMPILVPVHMNTLILMVLDVVAVLMASIL